MDPQPPRRASRPGSGRSLALLAAAFAPALLSPGRRLARRRLPVPRLPGAGGLALGGAARALRLAPPRARPRRARARAARGVALAAYLVGHRRRLGARSRARPLVAAARGRACSTRAARPGCASSPSRSASCSSWCRCRRAGSRRCIVRLQLFVSDASVRILQAARRRDRRARATCCVLPGGESLFVAEACSGVTSVITLAPLAVLLAYLTLRAARRARAASSRRWCRSRWRATSCACSRPSRGAALRRRASRREGRPTSSLGLLTYAVAVGLMLALGAALRRGEARRAPRRARDAAPSLTERVKGLARALGFDLVGIAPAEPSARTRFLAEWLAKGYGGELGFLARRAQEREDPRLVLPGARSVDRDGARLRRAAPARGAGRGGRVARYARGDDYHEVLGEPAAEPRRRPRAPRGRSPCARAATSTPGPVHGARPRGAGGPRLDRQEQLPDPPAARLVARSSASCSATSPSSPTSRSRTTAGAAAPVSTPVRPAPSPSPTCSMPRAASPTRRSSSRARFPPPLREAQGGRVFGCDVCQEVCPWNARPRRERARRIRWVSARASRPRAEWRAPTLAWLLELDEGAWQRATLRSALRRARHRRLAAQRPRGRGQRRRRLADPRGRAPRGGRRRAPRRARALGPREAPRGLG